ncbi:GNAT family N-acetyltransferase [Clostridium botulinum]|uniref:GNAT family acetyltransferase n=1 Tax=Clostridium botulinum C/D str. DC5 TaxID=1443128 RepID=A0A0A0IM97_CLOBO|nr:GNAT family protein [Clostridium botulinum]KEI07175.1 GNAT family acetyltransferase [Clostridium botulinum C/D str. BKT75002]KEI08733.1 GNAT family acetyltransferase [Clostridium botulinum C/D str. BKT2873]KGM96461.1 GNAT family acetyltransferase [Clostridium botulinum D str. CCUG 7971]KGN00681.1 GNAT family acetyltransferase [Clostridium botulinum C/D str. DC5]KOC45759.1 GNAT family acetyltransferase [Clostridium botulinum]
MKYKNIKLRREVFTSDAWKIIQWLENNLITRYLNEQQNVCKSIKDIIYRINMPILTHLFNQNGSFFMIIENDRDPIGFLRLVPKQQATEMVIVIGDKEKWGQGLGTSAIVQGLKHAFFEWRVDEVIAKINLKNERSRRVFKKVGFTKDRELQKEIQYSISIQKFLQLAS